MRECKKCSLQQPLENFAGNRRICRQCTNKRHRDNYNKNNASRRANIKAWRTANPDKVKAQTKRLNPEKKREKQRRWERTHPEMQILARARKRAKSKNIPFNLKLKDIIIPAVCPVLSLKLEVSTTGRLQDQSPSLDRIIPELGYVKDNVRVISWRANMLKNNATLKELELIVSDLRSISSSFVPLEDGKSMN